jgi:FkbM family methyltransferase
MKNRIWKKVKYIKIPWQATDEEADWQFEIILPEPLANWDVFSIWEVERVLSMRAKLEKEDILFDIGSESGWMSVVFAQMCRVFLVEPTKEFWPNIKQTWIRNVTQKPIGVFCGLVSDKTNFGSNLDYNNWPKSSDGDMIEENKYVYIESPELDTKIITIDDLEKRSGVLATALTIDVEGAELFVLRGAKNALTRGVKVWVSVHPDLMEKHGHTLTEINNLMMSYGYSTTLLGIDHEHHFYYEKTQ